MHNEWIELNEARGRRVNKMTVVYDDCAVEVEFEERGHRSYCADSFPILAGSEW